MTSQSANRDGGSESDKPVFDSDSLKEELRKLLNLQDLKGGSESRRGFRLGEQLKSTEEMVEILKREVRALNLCGPSQRCDQAKEPENKPANRGKRRGQTTLKGPDGRTIMFIRDFSPPRYPKSERALIY